MACVDRPDGPRGGTSKSGLVASEAAKEAGTWLLELGTFCSIFITMPHRYPKTTPPGGSLHGTGASSCPSPRTEGPGIASGLLAGLYLWMLMVLLVGSGAHAESAVERHTPSGDSTIVIETFDYPDQIGEFPSAWQGRTGWRQKTTKKKEDLYYTVQQEEDGNLFLRAATQGLATNAGKEADINLRIRKRLRWRWRVHKLPTGASEVDEDRNDSAASVRLVFKGRFVPKTLKYVWSASLAPGTETDSPTSDKTKVIVLQSGVQNLGKWVWQEVDAYADYKRLFGGEPRPVRAVAVITDSDNTQEPVMADYDDIMFLIPPADRPQDEDAGGPQEDP